MDFPICFVVAFKKWRRGQNAMLLRDELLLKGEKADDRVV